ncbi:hypothetical protein BDV98DRAFT_590148 [Pterulicium gracile]|uniref:BTB domain-containing protein n=1 Tax=Pterulicium gracile TaxID=1884261 RepID=A0A5C3R0U4_9AGAR|nr:hypothetical protein BDV98DRAFT_590148 [Pterula gracilis]
MGTRRASVPSSPNSTPPTTTPETSSWTVDQLSSLDKSDEYYLRTFTFRVEGTLFKVPQCRFVNESPIFRGMYSLPQQADAEGLSDDKPIDLTGVEKLDFTRFLRVLYPLGVQLSHSHGPTGPVDDWNSVLKLSTMWRFKDIRNLSVAQLVPLIGSLEPVMQVSLG